MQRLQTRYLLTVLAITTLNACSPAVQPPTTAFYLHDLDAAKSLVKQAAADPSKYQNDMSVANASAALAKAMSPSFLQCWPTKPASTATTDHACLDGKGFKK